MIVLHGVYGPHAMEKAGTSVWSRIHELKQEGAPLALVAPESPGERREDREAHEAFHNTHLMPLWQKADWKRIKAFLKTPPARGRMGELIDRFVQEHDVRLPSDAVAHIHTVHMLGIDLAASHFGLPSRAIEYATAGQQRKLQKLSRKAKEAEEAYRTATGVPAAREWFKKYFHRQAAYHLARMDVAAENVAELEQELPEGSHVLAAYGSTHKGNLRYIQQRLREKGVDVRIGSEVERPNAKTLFHELLQRKYEDAAFAPADEELDRALAHELLTSAAMEDHLQRAVGGREAGPLQRLRAQADLTDDPGFIEFVRENRDQLTRADIRRVRAALQQFYGS